MNSFSSDNGRSGFGLLGVLEIVFIVLKLTDNISWSWWWVLSPFLAYVLWIMFLRLILCFLEHSDKRREKKRRKRKHETDL